PARTDRFAPDSRALSQLAQIRVTSSALPGIRRTNTYEFPIDKFAAAQPHECLYQNVHALFRMHATDIDDDFCARLQRRRGSRRNRLRAWIWNGDDSLR